MTRLVKRKIFVKVNPETEAPEKIAFGQDRIGEVLEVLDHWREWIGILQGYPETDIWRVRIAEGICELHHYLPLEAAKSVLLQATPPDAESRGPDQWILHSWLD